MTPATPANPVPLQNSPAARRAGRGDPTVASVGTLPLGHQIHRGPTLPRIPGLPRPRAPRVPGASGAGASFHERPPDSHPPVTQISGYAATFRRLDAQSDLIQPGAFRDTLLRRRHRIPLLWQHDITEPLGRIQDIQEDDRGLWFRAELLPTRRGVDALRLIHAGALRECSIGFLPRRVRFQIHRGHRVRLVRELELVEISLVTLAANPAARILTVDGVPLDNGPPLPA